MSRSLSVDLTTMVLLLAPTLGWADLASDAHQVLEHRLAIPTPVTVFAKWQADQWTFAAAECLNGLDRRFAANATHDLARLNKLSVYLAGSRSLIKDLPETCAAMAAKGPDAECFGFHSYQEPFTSPWPGMQSIYLYLKNTKLPAEGLQVDVAAHCNLVKGRMDTQQFFSGNARLHWLSPPQMTQLRTFAGPRTVNMGTISFVVPGMPGAGRAMSVLVP